MLCHGKALSGTFHYGVGDVTIWEYPQKPSRPSLQMNIFPLNGKLRKETNFIRENVWPWPEVHDGITVWPDIFSLPWSTILMGNPVRRVHGGYASLCGIIQGHSIHAIAEGSNA
jgi:hypothetical protein